MKNFLIIGGVAAGTKTAAKLKRLEPDSKIMILTKDPDISYAGCGLPYYIGGTVASYDALIVNTPQKYTALTGVEVQTGWEVTSVQPQAQTVQARNQAGELQSFAYDELVIASGASASLPPLPGIEKAGVFSLRTPKDAQGILDYVSAAAVQRAVVIGAGFIGLETAENLMARGIQVTVVEAMPQILPNVLDADMAGWLQRRLQKEGLQILTGIRASRVLGETTVTGLQTEAGILRADLLVAAAGIRPNTKFLAGTDIELFKGTILVDEQLRTNLPHIYAVGDCAMVQNRLTHKVQWSPMGSSANLEGRVLAHVLHGIGASYPGVLGTSVIKLPGINCARTGLTEEAARAAGYDVITVTAVTDDKAHYYPGAAFFITRLIADRKAGQLLGMQVAGPGAVDKMADIAVMAIASAAALQDLESLDLAYAPPFSTAIHPFVQAIHILQNKLHGQLASFSPAEFLAGAASDYEIIDASPAPSIPGARYVNLTEVHGPLEGLPADKKLLLVCAKGKRGYLLQNRLRAFDYTNTRVLEGGLTFNQVRAAFRGGAIPESEIKRVKGLGFLRDKTTADCFNARVITRNGKISAEETQAITRAAELYGNGEIAMTTRLTIEIQHVPFSNIEPLIDYLQQAGLSTGGTGSKVRPVVSCKGTTCQYGLIDSFALSDEIHQRFYVGYHEVKLPHKFKIAVGGCPNNCVKPNLNDIGIVGQRVPQPDWSKCKGCKVCQAADSCPIRILKHEGGSQPTLDAAACNHCGRCTAACPFHVFDTAVDGYRIYIGGRWGKQVKHGVALDKVFTSKEEVLDTIEKAILLFRDQGITGERFADTIERLGFENVQRQLFDSALLAHKAENLAASKHLVGGATC